MKIILGCAHYFSFPRLRSGGR